MTIKQLNIIDFSGTRGRTVDLYDGFNIVEGKNESGKSTIVAFIKFMFYGFSDKAERMRLYSWGSRIARGTMTIEDNGKLYRIEREYTEGRQERVVIIDVASGTTLKTDRAPAQMFLGVPEKVFSSTVFVGQTDGSAVTDDKLAGSIENIIFSADETVNTEKALAKLDDERIRLYYKNRKGGKIHELLAERDEVSASLEKAKRDNSLLIEKEGTLREYKQRQQDNKEKYAALDAELTYCEAAEKYRLGEHKRELTQKLIQAQNAYEAQVGEFDLHGLTAEEYIMELESLSYEGAQLTEANRSLSAQLDDVLREDAQVAAEDAFLASLAAQGGEKGIKGRIEKIEKKRRASLAVNIALFVVAVAFALAAFAGFLDPEWYGSIVRSFGIDATTGAIVTGACSVFFLTLAVCGCIYCSRRRMELNELLIEIGVDTKQELEDRLSRLDMSETKVLIYRATVDDCRRKTAQNKQRFSEISARVTELTDSDDLSRIRDVTSRAREYMKRESALRAEVEKYRLSVEAVGAPYDEAEEKRLLEIIAGRPYDANSFDKEKIARDTKNRAFYASAINALAEKINDTEREIAVLNATARSPVELADELLCIERDLASATVRHEALLLAYQRLTEAADDLRASVSPRLSARAGELMKGLTHERYDTIGVGSDMSMEYVAADKMTHSIDYMSSGTRDLAYISLRFALSELLFAGKKAPMIFDESFSRLDDRRFDAVLRLIGKNAAEDRQMILFTSKSRDAEAAKEAGVDHKLILL